MSRQELPTKPGNSFPSNLLRDNFSFSTWLALGAALQCALLFLPLTPTHQSLPVLCLLAYKGLDLLLTTFGLKVNLVDQYNVKGKWAATLEHDPNSEGSLVVFMIGVKTSHPMGRATPVFGKTAQYFTKMIAQLSEPKNKVEFGYLGSTFCLGGQESSSNAINTIMYFRTIQGLHNYAHSPLHLEGWKFFNSITKEHPHMGIFHETYQSQVAEAIYVNMPKFGLGACTFQDPDTQKWTSTLVDARRGKHSTAAGRLGTGTGQEHDQFDNLTPSGKKIGPKERKVALLGSRAVGKSSLVVQFVDSHFVESYYPTIESSFEKKIKLRGQDFSLEIHDTAGQDEFSILQSKQAVGLHGWILVYSVTSRTSFEMITIIRDKILDYTGIDSVPMVIVGNKNDLDGQRQVPSSEARTLANQWKCAFTEASAKSNDNVAKIFELMVEQVEGAMNPEEAKKEGSKCAVS